jgi:hypothetical protein
MMSLSEEARLEQFLALLRAYVNRQHLVLQAVQELRPHRLRLAILLQDPSAPTSEIARLAETPESTTERGYWGSNNQWRYAFHGRGCRITHTASGETIDWDMPDVLTFDVYFFTRWLRWAASNRHDAALLAEALPLEQPEQATLEAILGELTNRGILRPVSGSAGTKYTLLTGHDLADQPATQPTSSHMTEVR